MQKYQNNVLTNSGQPLAGANVLVLNYPSGTQATIYSDNGTTLAANPLLTDFTGAFGFYAADGHYSLRISRFGIEPLTITDILLNDDIPTDEGVGIPLVGTELQSVFQNGGWVQKSLNTISQWATQTSLGFIQSFAGAASRTFLAKARESVSATDAAGSGIGVLDNSAAFSVVAEAGPAFSVPDGIYPFTAVAQSIINPLKIRGSSQYGTILKQNSTTLPGTLSSTGTTGTQISNLSIDATASGVSSNGHPIALVDVNDVVVSDVSITGLAGQGTGVIVYPNVNSTVNNVRLQDLKIIGNLANSSNTNAALIVNGRYSMMRGIYAEGIHDFALEWKNATSFSLLSDSIVNNSAIALEFGFTSGSGTTCTLANNLIAKDCSIAVGMGQATYNSLNNALFSIQSAFPGGSSNGIVTINGSNWNSFSNILFTGSFNNPVYHSANYNYVSGAFHTTGTTVNLQAGAAGNVTAINHPGARTSILTSISNSSGNAVSGTNSNPTYCHATGEYVGSFSGRWRWSQDLSSVAPQSTDHKWIGETKGSGYFNVLSDGTGANGYTVSTTGKTHSLWYVWSGDYWSLDSGSTFYRFYPNVFQAQTDVASQLGQPANRWANVYSRNIELTPPASVTPGANGSMSFQLTSDTSLTIKVKGSDGVVRSASLILT